MADARQAVSTVDNLQQALYREAQLAVRAVVGARELDTFLVDRDTVARELEELLRQRVSEFGLEVVSVGAIIDGERYTASSDLDDQPAMETKTTSGSSSDSKLRDQYQFGFTEGTQIGFEYVSRFRNVAPAGAEVVRSAYLKTLSDLDDACESLLRTYGQENKNTQRMLGKRDGLRKKLK